jgi:hypothetical protein
MPGATASQPQPPGVPSPVAARPANPSPVAASPVAASPVAARPANPSPVAASPVAAPSRVLAFAPRVRTGAPSRVAAAAPAGAAQAGETLLVSSAIPEPPSDEPAAYAAWLRGLPRSQRQKIAAICRADPLTYRRECGGIGPLHIPMPPHVRAFAQASQPTSRFADWDDWHAALTAVQRRYVERACPGGEGHESSDLCGESTPLVVAFHDQPIEFTPGGTFAFAPGAPVGTDWPTATTPWIALDRNGDGTIDSGAELFGDNTVLPDGTTARNGFIALAALDANHDGRIDASDPGFASLVLWADRNGDHRSTPEELTPLGDVIVSISLDDHVALRCDARNNCEGERAALRWRHGGALHDGAAVDVYLPRRSRATAAPRP